MSHEPNTFAFKLPFGNSIPRFIRRGDETLLDCNWFRGESVVTSPDLTSGTFTLKQGSRVIIDAQPVSFAFPGVSCSYTLTAADTQDLPFSDTMLEIWDLFGTIGGEDNHVTVRKSGHLVRTLLWPMIQDSDLIARHSRILDLLPPGYGEFQKYRILAWEILNRDLIKQGRRPELILDSYALIDLHVYKSLELIFRDAITFVGDGRYNELADLYSEKYREEWLNVAFRYDRNEDDAIQDSELEAASPSVWLGEPPPGWPSLWTRGN